MSFQSPAPSPSFSTLARERATSPSNNSGDVSATESSPIKKTIGKDKNVPKNRVATRTNPSEPTDTPASQGVEYSYEPYRKADSTPEPERSRPANPKDLEALETSAKAIYKSDREVVEYIEAVNRRTAGILEYVNRTSPQLRSCEGVMDRIELFISRQQNTSGGWARPPLFGNDSLREKPVDNTTLAFGSDEEGNDPCVGFFFSLP